MTEPVSPRVDTLPGITPEEAYCLYNNGVKTAHDVLMRALTKKDVAILAKKTALPEERIIEWAKMADLIRVSQISVKRTALLRWAGIFTIADLRSQDAVSLCDKLREVNEEHRVCKTNSTCLLVRGLIEQAKVLRIILEDM